MPIQNAEAAMAAAAAKMPTPARVRALPWARRSANGASAGSAAVARAAMAVSGLIAHSGASPTRMGGLKPVCPPPRGCVHEDPADQSTEQESRSAEPGPQLA